MGLYGDFILPSLIHWAMQNPEAARHRRRILPAARGRVLEIGIGSGLNLPFYGGAVTSVIGLDPAPGLLEKAREAAREAAFAVDLQCATAEAMPFEARRFDSVVATWTLCSVARPAEALAEVRRVLKPGGELIFIEHGRAPEAGVRAWQERLTPLWRRCAGGCHLDRDMAAALRQAGFRLAELEEGYLLKGPRFLTYHFAGRAVPG